MNDMKLINSLVLAAVFAGASALLAAELPPAADKKDVTYVSDVKPIFDKNCVGCHGPEKQKAKLRLDSLAAALKGSEEGRVIEPGNSAKSDLVKSVAHVGDPDDYMPRGRNAKPLTGEQIGLIRAWIDQGAK